MRAVYVYDKNTGNYLWSQSIPDRIYDHAGKCTWDGLNDNMTEIAPPDCPTGYHLHWTGTTWKTIADPVPETPHIPTEEERLASLTPEQKAEEVRAKRDSLIEDVSWRIERYQTQRDLGIPTTDSAETYMQILQYVQDLRDIPAQGGFPADIAWPTLPA